MKRSLLVTVLVSAPLCAQMGLPGPAPQLEKFEKFLGVWEGSGTASQGPGTPDMPWTATVRLDRAFGGHFVRERVVVDFSPAFAQPLVMISHYGWDRENARYVAHQVSNQGVIASSAVSWEGGKMVLARSGIEKKQAFVERSQVDIVDGKYWFRVERANGAGAFFTHVEGSLSSAETVEASQPSHPDVTFIDSHGVEEMAALDFWCGDWRMKGTMVPAPGQPNIPIAGTERARKIFGGTALMTEIVGEPMMGFSYQGSMFVTWSPVKRCYDAVMFDNMGVVYTAEARLLGNELVFNTALMAMGQPKSERTVLVRGEDGVMNAAYTEVFWGTGDASRTFDARYEKAK